MFKIFIFIITLLFASNSFACNFRNVIFGTDIEHVSGKYKIEGLGASETGMSTLDFGGKTVCNNLPEESIIEFIFIDNTFVKLNIHNKNNDHQLFNLATKIFGEQDNKNEEKADDKTHLKTALWVPDKSKTILYIIRKKNDDEVEYLEITSLKHKLLFEKISKQQGQQYNDYLKKNKLGKYSTDKKGKTIHLPNQKRKMGDSFETNKECSFNRGDKRCE